IPASQVTAQANSYQSLNRERDYVRSVNPSDSHADFVFSCNANVSGSCNAYYDGTSVNFYRAGGSCVNFAYSEICNHEQGHWLNDQYGTGNGSDGMGEGNADTWSLYVNNHGITGEDYA